MITDDNGTITYVNDLLSALSGYSSEELIGHNPRILRSGVHTKSFYEDLWTTIKSGNVWRGVLCNRNKNGALYWLSDTIVPFVNDDGEPYQFISIRKDITEQKRLEHLLKENDKKLTSLLKYSSEGIGILSEEGRVVYGSPFFLNIINEIEGNLQNKKLQELMHDDDIKMYQECISQSLNNPKKPIITEVRLFHSDKWIDCEIVLNNYLSDPAINGFVINMRDVTEKKVAQKQIEYIAYHDFLTGLKNRRYFEDELTLQLKRAKAENISLAVLILDLDRFKFINDTLGHYIGDKLLKQLGERLNRFSDDGVVISRIGGDEFGILLTNQNKIGQLKEFLKKLLSLFNEPYMMEDLEFFITASIGVALYPECGEDVKTLLQNADTALYRVKEEGKNNYLIFNPNMDIDSYKKFMIMNDLRKAIEKDELEVHFQPKVETVSNKIVGAEALIRWKHPIWGYIPPNEFIVIAEETRMINELGDWVLEAVCKQIKLLEEKRIPLIPISINFSSIQFLQQNLVEKIKMTLFNYDVDPELIEIELTETSLINNEAQINATLEELREIGIKIAIDDFGTGYSSLVYLKKFKIDVLKIDQIFMKNITTEKNSQQIFNAIVKLAESLQMDLIVEGVETMGQLQLIKNHEDIIVQGYLFSKPVPSSKFEKLLYGGRCDPTVNEDIVLRKERRQYFRIDLMKPIEAKMTLLQIGQKPVNIGYTKILIENIGPGGLKFLSHINLPVRKDMLLKFKFKILGCLIEINGKIIWSSPLKNNIFQYGIEFVCNETAKTNLVQVLNHLQITLKKNPVAPECNMIAESKYAYFKKIVS